MAKVVSKGIDVSEWNTILNYNTVAENIDFVIPHECFRPGRHPVSSDLCCRSS